MIGDDRESHQRDLYESIDGAMRLDDNGGGSVNYEPNSFGEPIESNAAREPRALAAGDVDRYDHHDGNDDYAQAGDLFRLMSAEQKQQLFGNIASSMRGVPKEIVIRQLDHFRKADPAYADGVAAALEGTALADDVVATKNTLAEQDGPAVLVGHSYGGAIITEAGTDPKVAALVYISAFVPDEGESVEPYDELVPTTAHRLLRPSGHAPSCASAERLAGKEIS